jgi:archaellin
MPSAVDDSTTTSTTMLPTVEDMVLQQLQDALTAATNAPLCDATGSSIAQATFHKCVASWTYGLVDGLSAEPSIDADASQNCNVTLSRCIIPENSNSCEVTAESEGFQVFATTLNLAGMGYADSRVVTFEWTEGDVSEPSDTTVATTVDTTVDTTLPESVEALVAGPGQVICSASLSNGSFSFSCERVLNVSYFTSAGGPEEMALSNATNSLFVWNHTSDITTVRVVVDNGSGNVFNETISDPATANKTWEFLVPVYEDETEVEFEWPYFGGVLQPNADNENLVSFTIPEDYSTPFYSLELYADCDSQSIEADVLFEGGFPLWEIPQEYLPDGLCGVWITGDTSQIFEFFGTTFEVVVRTNTAAQIMWSGTVALEGPGVIRDGDPVIEGDQGLVWDELFSGEIDAEHVMTFEIPKGGKQIDIRGITTRFENQEYVDPYLYVLDDTYDVIARNNDGGEDYGFGDYSSRLNVFLEEGTYTLIASTYDIWIGAEAQWPTTYDLELRVGSVPVPTDEAVPSGEQPKEQQVLVEVLDAPPSDLDQSSPVFVLPVNEVINGDKSSNEPNPVIPAGVTEVVCDSGCLTALREAAGVSEGIVTIQIGGEVIEIQPGVRNAIIPVRPSAKEILVTVTPSAGGEPVVLSTEVKVISSRTFPTEMVEGAKSVLKTNQGSEGLPTNLIVVLSVLALAIAFGLVRRNKVRTPE